MRFSTVCFGFTFLVCPIVGTLDATAQTVRFDRDIRPILSDKCFHCHGPNEEHREANLRLDLEGPAKESAIVPGRANESELVRRILSRDADEMMPPSAAKKPLRPEEIDLLKRWVEQGAEWTDHWSFLPPARGDVPNVVAALPDADSERLENWTRNAIDQFILARLQTDGLAPNDEADRRTLIRRVTFDLTGLPPTPAEADAFVHDDSENAYETVVDRLLQSPHYGERMAL